LELRKGGLKRRRSEQRKEFYFKTRQFREGGGGTRINLEKPSRGREVFGG